MNFQNKNLVNEVLDYRRVVQSKDIQIYSSAARELRYYMIENDPHYPIYHFAGPESWINDPNGPIYLKGKYHLFYQYDPIVKGKRSARCWGHAVSDELVHWVDWPVAIWPDSPYDKNGVYSGNTVIDDQGIPAALYTGNVNGHKESYGLLAKSYDGLLSWEKKMVMDKAPYPGTPVHWDAQIWKDGDAWYQLIGGTWRGGGAALLWSSPDLIRWTFRKRIYASKEYGNFWELPYLLPFDNGYALIIGVWPIRYWVGTYDRNRFVFTPDNPEAKILDYSTSFYAPNCHLVDDRGPGGTSRRIMLAWIRQGTVSKDVPYWEGMISIPRVLTLESGRLFQRPVPELKTLRGKHWSFTNLIITPGSDESLRNIQGDALEIIAEFEMGESRAGEFGIKLRASKDGRQYTRVSYNAGTENFGIDGHVSRLKDSPGQGPAELTAGQNVKMHIFLDRSVLEVFLNGHTQTERLFLHPDSVGLNVFAQEESVKLKSLDVWQMQSIW